MTAQTPLMQQYRDIKARHQHAIVFFRMGEFYEMFYDDAELAARLLGLTLTSRNNGGAADVPLAGVPVKAAGEYVRRLVEQGYRVAICEQVEDPKVAKGVVRREVIETISPGVALSDDLLHGGRHNFVCAIYIRTRGGWCGCGGHLHRRAAAALLRAVDNLEALMGRLDPREILVARGAGAVERRRRRLGPRARW